MEKILRSFIHEKFDLDTRYEIELLTKRRDLINSERQEELIKLLQSKNVGEIVKLGPGTNRYAFKLDGFVVKVATDHDGKIDNLKEFKMAKRLYPYVAKTYEVSENGTLLVAEYIQPFGDFSEMCKYSEKIKDILQKLSAVYLIGDVGLIPKNFANWGLRVGTQDPVCLDFAYVYDVSSKLFVCTECNTGAVLHPSQDFSELVCSNPGCQKRFTFESIRAKIGNDIHRHEIGDLSEEGYRLTESHVLTQLDENRSNYLAKRKFKDKGKSPEPDKPKLDQSENNKEEPDMSTTIDRYMNPTEADADTIAPFRIRCTATITKKPEESKPQEEQKLQKNSIYGHTGPIPAATILHQNGGHAPVEEEEVIPPSKVAFSGKINPTDIDGTAGEPPIQQHVDPSSMPTPKPYEVGGPVVTGSLTKDKPSKPQVVVATVRIPGQDNPKPPVTSEIPEELRDAAPKGTATVEAQGIDEMTQREAQVRGHALYGATGVDPEKEADPAPKKEYQFSQSFINRAKDAVSRIANRIGDHMHVMLVHDDVKTHIRDKKMYPETFYKNVQNAAFNSLAAYLGFTKSEKPKDNGKGVIKIYTPPENLHGEYEPTLIFIERIWNLRELNTMNDSAAMLEKYRSIFSDYHGIQREWAKYFEQRLLEKMPIDKTGAAMIAQIAKDVWCVEPDYDHQPIVMDEPGIPEENPAPEHQPEEPNEEPLDPNAIVNDVISGTMSVDEFNKLDPDTQMNIAVMVINKGKEMYPSYRPVPGAPVEQLVFLELAVGDDRYPIAEVVNFDELKTSILINGSEVQTVTYHTMGDLVRFLGTLVPDNRVDVYSALLTAMLGLSEEEEGDEDEATEVAGFGAGAAAAEILGREPEDDPEDDGQYVEDGDGEEDEVEVLSVSIYNDGDFDIVKVSSGEAFGHIDIPFYCNLDKIDITNMAPSVVDNRNGKWDWLIHMVPDIIFTTTNPERYLEVNDKNLGDTQTAKFVILDVERGGMFTMGMYFIDSIAIIDDEMVPHVVSDEDTLWKINRLIVEDIGYSRISHLRRTLAMPDLIRDEDYILNDVLPAYQDVIDGRQHGEEMPEFPPLNDTERAALQIMMGGEKALGPDATPEQRAAAEHFKAMAMSSIGMPVMAFPAEMESGIHHVPDHKPDADGDEGGEGDGEPKNDGFDHEPERDLPGATEPEHPEKERVLFHPIRRPRQRDVDREIERDFGRDR